MTPSVPADYSRTARVVLRFVVVMAIFGMLTGVLFQESGKKLPDDAVRSGIGLDSVLGLALVHGHVLVAAVIMPLALLGAAFLALASGGAELSGRCLKALTRGYLPFTTAAVLLMLYKGYHVLLSVRGGESDLLVIDAAYFGGVTAARHTVYGVVHVGMFVAMVWFLVGIWRSLRSERITEGGSA